MNVVVQPMVMRTQSALRVRSRDDTVCTRTTTKMAEALSVGSTSGLGVTPARQWTSSTRAPCDLVCTAAVCVCSLNTFPHAEATLLLIIIPNSLSKVKIKLAYIFPIVP